MLRVRQTRAEQQSEPEQLVQCHHLSLSLQRHERCGADQIVVRIHDCNFIELAQSTATWYSYVCGNSRELSDRNPLGEPNCFMPRCARCQPAG